MTLTPGQYADQFVSDLDLADLLRDRTLQTHDRQLGVSDIGNCREYARRLITGEPFTDAPRTGKARAGSYFHEGALVARGNARSDLLIERKVHLTLSNGIEVDGHADEIDPGEPSVTDLKTLDTDKEVLAVRRHGASPQQRWQRHLYAEGAVQEGIIDPSRDITVRNIWMARSGSSTDLVHVEQEPYDKAQVQAATRWMDDVLQAVRDGEEASKDREYHYCQRFCPFFTACRGGVNPGPELTDPDLIESARRYYEAKQQMKEAEGVIKLEREALEGATGFAGKYRIRTTYIDPNGNRVGHSRLEVEPR